MALMMVPEAWVEVVESPVSAVLFPTALPKVMLPDPAVTVRALAPLTAPLNVTALLVVARVALAPKVITPV